VERRGRAIRVRVNLVNRQREEPNDCGGGRQLSLNGTSRVTGDCHARFCERLGVKSPGATRRRSAMAAPTAKVIFLLGSVAVSEGRYAYCRVQSQISDSVTRRE
jgi:hypothetical protein